MNNSKTTATIKATNTITTTTNTTVFATTTITTTINPFPHDKILDQTKLKAFADDKSSI